MLEKTRLGVIVPCYNEENNVDYFEKELSDFLASVASNPGLEVKFYIVDNNSTDKTSEKLAVLASKYRDVTVCKCDSQGYGAALKYGFTQAASNHFLGFLDFDNTYPMISFIDLLERLKSQNLDLVFGARLHSSSKIDPVRRAGNFLFVCLLKVLLGSELSDVCSGMRVFKAEHVNKIASLKSNDLSFSIHFTSIAVIKKWRVGEVPILYRERIGASKLSVHKDGVKFLLIAIKAFITRS